jgi:serine/threonine protein kinase
VRDRKKIEKEIEIIKSLKNPYVIQYYDTYSDNKEAFIIMEYAENGALTKFINENENQPHNWKLNDKFVKQMVLGLSYIHSKFITHRDLKSLNILLTSGYNVKLSDFGLSKVKTISSTYSKHDISGTLR